MYITQDGSSDGARGRGKSTRNSRKDKLQRGGDFDVAGLLKKMAKIGVDDLRRQLKNPLKEMQVPVYAFTVRLTRYGGYMIVPCWSIPALRPFLVTIPPASRDDTVQNSYPRGVQNSFKSTPQGLAAAGSRTPTG